MKRNFIILGLFLFLAQNVFAVEKIYLQEPYPYQYNRQFHNPYNYNKYNHYRYKKNYYNDAKKLQRIQKIKLLNRIRNNFLTWSNNGTLTGYSVPVNQNIIYPASNNYFNKKYQYNSPTLTTELFSSPIITDTYYRNGEIKRYTDGISSKTGVTIIYD